MTTILEAAKGLLSNLVDDSPKGALHVGEVMNLWTYYTLLNEINRFVEIGLNTTNDADLVKALMNSKADCTAEVNEIAKLFETEGIPLPATSESKPKSEQADVPAGARMTEEEIANGLVVKQGTSLVFCATGLSQTLRGDIASLWLRFFLKKVEFSAYFMPIHKKRGWLKLPPLYQAPGLPSR